MLYKIKREKIKIKRKIKREFIYKYKNTKIQMSYPIHRLRRSVSLQANPSFLNILDTINPDEVDDDEYDDGDDDPSNFSTEKTAFGCRCCRKWLISKYALDRHLARCFITKIEKINEIYENDLNNQFRYMELLKKQYQEDMELLKKQYQDDMELMKNRHLDEISSLNENYDAYIDFLQKNSKSTDQKWLALYETMFSEMKAIVMKDKDESKD